MSVTEQSLALKNIKSEAVEYEWTVWYRGSK